MPKIPKIIDPLEAEFDAVVRKIIDPAPHKVHNSKDLDDILPSQPTPLARQIPLDLGVQIQKNVDGIEMGVLDNGVPYLTQVGLAKLCGASRPTISEVSKEWEEKFVDSVIDRGRNAFLKNYLFEKGYREPTLYIETKKDGSIHYAYPDLVCMALLEYYAFESQSQNDVAITNFRRLASYGLQKFIYEALHYVPADKWKYFNDRVSILKDSAPDGYFIVFRETMGLVVDLINAGLTVNHKTLPDGSVGGTWGRFWTNSELETRFGARVKYDHYYPPEYPQSASNPQEAWAYPDAAIPLFRRWFKSQYLQTKYPRYILGKAHMLSGGKIEAQQMAALFETKRLESG